MKKFLVAWMWYLVVMLAVDVPFFFLCGIPFYQKQIGHLIRATPQLFPGALVYLLYSLGVLVFVLAPALRSGQGYFKTFVYGALFGAVASGTYDLTNQALMNDWPALVTIVDMCWVSFLTGVVSALAQGLASR